MWCLLTLQADYHMTDKLGHEGVHGFVHQILANEGKISRPDFTSIWDVKYCQRTISFDVETLKGVLLNKDFKLASD